MFTDLICEAISSITTINSESSDDDWSYMFMPDPIAGGTEDIEDMYDSTSETSNNN